jgi:DNA segregation ATPase FtsK/SpoIIIE-like protein
VIVDEVYALLEAGGDAAASAISGIASVGREFGIHLILATQHPLADAIGGSLAKANLPLRLCGKVRDANAAYMATGVKQSGAEGLTGEGDFILTAGGEVYRVQIAKITQRDIYGLPRADDPRSLDLDAVDLDRVLSVTNTTGKPGRPSAPIKPDHVAHAMVTGQGIDKLRRNLKIGQPRASIVRKFALRLVEELQKRGHAIYPISEMGPGVGQIAAQGTRGI